MNLRTVFCGLLAAAAATAGVVLATQHPLAPVAVATLFAVWSVVAFRWPLAMLVVLPGLLPIIDLATWTGWFAFEEFDLLVLGAAAAGYLRLAMPRPHAPPRGRSMLPSQSAIALALLFAVSCAMSLYRGVADAGGLRFDWIGDYDGAMNSFRLAKSFAFALLLWPVVIDLLRRDERRAAHALAAGLVLGLALVSLAALWERAAFTDLLNFSSDYRTTALFWEMHMGGAAFDGFLALTVPFTLLAIMSSYSWPRLGMALALSGLAAYACLTTFSRGVYLAEAVSFAVLALLLVRSNAVVREHATMAELAKVALLAGVVIAGSYLVFRAGGYRSLLALMATFAIVLQVRRSSYPLDARTLGLALLAAGVLAGVGTLGATLVPKGPYVMFALVFAGNVVSLVWQAGGQGRGLAVARWTLLFWLMAAAAMVALHWGGERAFVDSVIALSFLLALALREGLASSSWMPATLRLRFVWLGFGMLIGACVAIFSGGAYMGDRFSEAAGDLQGRMRHWHASTDMLHGSTELWLGKGLGRYPASYFFGVPNESNPGSFALHYGEGERFLSLAGPRSPASWGELYRVSQRVTAAPGHYSVVIVARAAQDTAIQFEVCEQHLLYNGACGSGSTTLRGGGGWRSASVVLDGDTINRGPWYSPRLAFFSMAVPSSAMSVDIREVSVLGPDGRNVIANGDFAAGMARWIPISERDHLPWHIKNIGLNLLFDQGLLGLAVFLILLAMALWRLAFGRARFHSLAPYLAAGFVGFLVVGIFDSLLDVPRLAFLFYYMILTSLCLQSPDPA